MSGPTRTPEDLMADIQRYLSLSVANSIPCEQWFLQAGRYGRETTVSNRLSL